MIWWIDHPILYVAIEGPNKTRIRQALKAFSSQPVVSHMDPLKTYRRERELRQLSQQPHVEDQSDWALFPEKNYFHICAISRFIFSHWPEIVNCSDWASSTEILQNIWIFHFIFAQFKNLPENTSRESFLFSGAPQTLGQAHSCSVWSPVTRGKAIDQLLGRSDRQTSQLTSSLAGW